MFHERKRGCYIWPITIPLANWYLRRYLQNEFCRKPSMRSSEDVRPEKHQKNVYHIKIHKCIGNGIWCQRQCDEKWKKSEPPWLHAWHTEEINDQPHQFHLPLYNNPEIIHVYTLPLHVYLTHHCHAIYIATKKEEPARSKVEFWSDYSFITILINLSFCRSKLAMQACFDISC